MKRPRAGVRRAAAPSGGGLRAAAPFVHPARAAALWLNTTTPGMTDSGSRPSPTTASSKTAPKHLCART